MSTLISLSKRVFILRIDCIFLTFVCVYQSMILVCSFWLMLSDGLFWLYKLKELSDVGVCVLR